MFVDAEQVEQNLNMLVKKKLLLVCLINIFLIMYITYLCILCHVIILLKFQVFMGT